MLGYPLLAALGERGLRGVLAHEIGAVDRIKNLLDLRQHGEKALWRRFAELGIEPIPVPKKPPRGKSRG